VDRYQAFADHLVQMDGKSGLRLAGHLGELGQGQIPILEFVQDLPSDIVGYLNQTVLGVIQLEISERAVGHGIRA